MPNSLEIGYMRQSGKIVADCFTLIKKMIKPGVTGKQLDTAVEELIVSRGAKPAFKGYTPAGMTPFPSSICISFNEEVIHGIPGTRAVKDGDVVSIDIGVEYNGWFGDSACTFLVGDVDPAAREMSDLTQAALSAAIQICEPGNYIGDIGKVIEAVIRRKGYGIVRTFCGHSIGKRMHDGISIINYYDPKRRGPKLEVGMALAIEPMINLGGAEVKVLSDGWTVVTTDGKASCHWEHTVAITKDGPVILTARDE
ncbi:MAG: type I methionyl aminopeptidase [Brevinema sp.]